MDHNIGFRLKWLGCACFEMDFGDITVVNDPWITPNQKTELSWETVEKCHYISLTHGHYDHTLDIPVLAKKFDPYILCGENTAIPLMKWADLNPMKVYPMNPGLELDLDAVKIKAIFGRHSRLPGTVNQRMEAAKTHSVNSTDPNLMELVGHGLSFCAVCDGAFYTGMDTAMIGGGNSAMQEALLLSEVCRKVTIVQNLADFTGERKLAEALLAKDNVEIHFSTLVNSYITENGNLTGLELRNDITGEISTLKVDGAFLAVGLMPENQAFANLTQLNDWGYFDSGEDCRTKTEGLFVAGDCRSKRIRQVVTAASDGAIAATAACAYIDNL